jgi:hypothetical protein
VLFGVKGGDAARENALYGKTIFTVSPPDRLFASVKVTCGFVVRSWALYVALTR